jgi:arylsulfatase A-like enzyme
MKLMFFLFDFLNRNALSCYNDEAPPTPNFDRVTPRGTVFDTHYAKAMRPAHRQTQFPASQLRTDGTLR